MDAGPDQTITLPKGAVLRGIVEDDGLPVGSTLTSGWQQVSGPAQAVFSSPTSAETNVSFTAAGIYVLQLTASDSALSSSANVTITVLAHPTNQAPVVNAGSNITIDFVKNASGLVHLVGTASDDGIPATAKLLTQWTVVSGPKPVLFSSPTALATDATFTSSGAVDTYILRLTADDSELKTTSDITVTLIPSNTPPQVNIASRVSSITLPANSISFTPIVTDDGLPAGVPLTFQWSMTFGASPVVFSAPTSKNTTVTISAAGTYNLQLAVSDSEFTTTSSTQITVNPANAAPVVSVPSSATVTLPGTLTINASATDDANPPGSVLTFQWLQQSGPAPVTFSAPTALSTTVTFSQAGSYLLSLAANDSQLTGTGFISVTVNPINMAPVVFPGPDQTLALPANTLTLAGTVTDDGLPAGVPLSIQWSTISGPAPVTFSAPTSATTIATFTTAGNYVLQLSASDSLLSSSRTMNVTVFAAPQNQPPTVSAGPNQITTIQSLTSPAQVFLNASIKDDGLPVGKPVTSTWTQISGPAAAAIISPTSAQTFVNFTVPGIYVLRITASDTQLTSSSDLQITVNPPINRAPVLTGLVNPVITLPANTSSFSTAGVVDDGLPVGGTVTTLLTQTSGPAPIQFADPTKLNTLMTFSAPGSYGVRISASDTQLTATAFLTVTVNQANKAPVINGPGGYTLVQPATTLTFTNTVTDDGQPAGAPLTTQWTQVSGPQLAQFVDPTNPQTTATFPAAGAYVLKLSASDTQLTTIATINVVVQPPDAPAPFVKILTPGDGSEITEPVPVVITSSTESWALEYALNNPDGSVPQTFTRLAGFAGTATAVNVATFDPTILANGIYTIRLTGRSSSLATALISTDSVTVTVRGRAKPGAVHLAFRDLTVPVPGMPIDIVRVYDSLDTGVHEFGQGWSLSLNGARLQRNRNIGFGWTETASQTAFPTFCLVSNNDRFVTISFPDGRIYKFRAVALPECDIINPITVPALGFQQVPTGSATAGATLAPADGASLLVDGAVPGPVNIVDLTGQPYNPTVFRLTTMEGFTYVIDQNLGVTSITDPNNNVINIGPNGISSSSGINVAFIRNGAGEITQINDPQGNPSLTYAYNTVNQLATFTDAVGNKTTFGYAGTFLSSILDARGVNVLQNSFSGGRLSSSLDASQQTTHYTYDTAAQHETVFDRLGNSTTYGYDDDGNIISVTDALGKTSFATYDANDNKLTSTNALGKTSSYTYDESGNRLTETDPLGNVTTYAYNGRHQVLSTIDPLGHSTINNYDANGNLLDTTDPLGNKTTYTYNGQGLPVTVTDAAKGKTTFAYDAAGHLTSQTDALNNVTNFTYDANGNRLTQAVTRTKSDGTKETLTTSYVYDADNRVTITTNPDQTVTRVAYNSIGKQSDIFDAFQRKTHYDYDNNGRLKTVTYPDLTFDSYTYDLDDHKLTMTDRASRTTSYAYDLVGRLKQTTYPDTTFTQTVYDAAGRVAQTVDALTNSTFYGYDDADRRTTVTDAAGKITTSAYDAAGNQSFVLDALQHKTQFLYDAANHRVQTLYADTTSDFVQYDALGRQAAKTDQAGKLTQYGYDPLGRLTTVTQFLNNQPLVTSYGYDEIGNRTGQTDANGHTTKYSYDQMGRRSTRTLPLGQSESYAYDAAGNLASRTDFNQHTTTFSYDNMNRLKQKTADVFFSTGACAPGAGPAGLASPCGAAQISYTYTATGRRLSMTDAAGTTNYSYDLRDRLLTKATPFGTLTYTYDAAGNMHSLQSSNVGGAAMTYAYDALNRLASVTDASGATTYSYDAVGNLSGYVYPNGVSTGYGYDPLNRLTNMQSTCATGTGCGTPGSPVASYAYTLGAAGNRLSVAELSGRTVNYGYDDLYRLTSENVVCGTAPGCASGNVSYQYDSVGNRLQRNSTLPAITATGLLNYDANDRTATDPYDANGNLLNGGVGSNIYDFENHMVAAGGVSLVYDGDGNRVQETVAGVTTSYLVADQNLTGYAQVLDELQGGVVSRTYSYGLSLINEQQSVAGAPTISFYGFDGHGSVRFLTSSTGAVTDTYDYDAFGSLVASTGSTPNNYRFAGEQFDPLLGIYYNRARYYDQRQGRFWSMDKHRVLPSDPATIHRFSYTRANPVNRIDHSGLDDLGEISISESIDETLETVSVPQRAVQTTAQIGDELSVTTEVEADAVQDAESLVDEAEGAEAQEGEWVEENISNSRAAEYQAKITGQSRQAFRLNGVNFDGVSNTGDLLEAKGPGYARLFQQGFGDDVMSKLLAQAGRQVAAAGGRQIIWHFAEEEAAGAFLERIKTTTAAIIKVAVTP